MKLPFQTIILGIFIVIFIIAILIFSGILSTGSNNNQQTIGGQVVIWGTLPGNSLQTFLNDFNTNSTEIGLIYVQRSPETLYQDLMMAIADGVPPDLILFNSENFTQFKDKLYMIPYQAYSERMFADTNVDGSRIFMTPQGLVGFPLLVDPLVVYYNKDILASSNFVNPPRTWTSLVQTVPILTKRTTQHTISQSTIALGEVDNVRHFRDIISNLFLQAGNNIVNIDQSTGRVSSTLVVDSLTSEASPIEQALSFYTNFANPTNVTYSWHKNLPESIDYFVSGRSAFYIGRASEIFTIRDKNPNLNFDVMEMFQTSSNARPVTYGSFIGAGVLKSSNNFNTAYVVAGMLAEPINIDSLSKSLSIPPVRKDLLQISQTDPYISVFFRAAISSFSWTDPNPVKTKQIFRDMINNINSGRFDINRALNEVVKEFQNV